MASKRPADVDFNPPGHPKRFDARLSPNTLPRHYDSYRPDASRRLSASASSVAHSAIEPAGDPNRVNELEQLLSSYHDSSLQEFRTTVHVENATATLSHHEADAKKVAKTKGLDAYALSNSRLLEFAKSDLSTSQDRLVASHSVSQGHLSSIAALIAATTQTASSDTSRLNALESRLDEQQEQITKLKQENDWLLAREKQRTDEIEALRTILPSDLPATLSTLEQGLPALEHKLTNILHEKLAPLCKIDSLTSNFDDVRSQVNDHSREINDLFEAQKRDLQWLKRLDKSETDHLESRKTLEVAAQGQSKAITDLESKLCVVVEEACEKIKPLVKQDIDAFSRELRRYEDWLKELEQRQISTPNQHHSSSTAAFEKDLLELKASVETLSSRLGGSEQRQISAQSQTDTASQTIAAVNKKLDAMADSIEHLRTQAVAGVHTPPGTPPTQKPHDQLKKEVKILQEAFRELEDRFDNLTTEKVVQQMCNEFDRRNGFENHRRSVQEIIAGLVHRVNTSQNAIGLLDTRLKVAETSHVKLQAAIKPISALQSQSSEFANKFARLDAEARHFDIRLKEIESARVRPEAAIEPISDLASRPSEFANKFNRLQEDSKFMHSRIEKIESAGVGLKAAIEPISGLCDKFDRHEKQFQYMDVRLKAVENVSEANREALEPLPSLAIQSSDFDQKFIHHDALSKSLDVRLKAVETASANLGEAVEPVESLVRRLGEAEKNTNIALEKATDSSTRLDIVENTMHTLAKNGEDTWVALDLAKIDTESAKKAAHEALAVSRECANECVNKDKEWREVRDTCQVAYDAHLSEYHISKAATPATSAFTGPSASPLKRNVHAQERQPPAHMKHDKNRPSSRDPVTPPRTKEQQLRRKNQPHQPSRLKNEGTPVPAPRAPFFQPPTNARRSSNAHSPIFIDDDDDDD